MSGIFSRVWAVWRRQSRYFIGEDLEGNRYFEIPSKRADLSRPTRRVEYNRASYDVTQNANRARQLPVQWTSWLSHTRPDPPTLQELQSDVLRRQRLQQNVQMIENREREEREQQMLARSESQPLRVSSGNEQHSTSTTQEPPKDVEDPWERAKREAPPEEPSSWQPQVSSRRRT